MFTLVIGGAGSGKSAFAEDVCCQSGGPLLYVATMEAFGEESQQRIRRHAALREGKGFAVVEVPCHLASCALPKVRSALLEDMGNLVANELFSTGASEARTTEERVLTAVMAGVDTVAATCEHLVVVTVDVGADGVSYDAETEAYRRVLAQANAVCALQADCVVEVVCGLPVWLKGSVQTNGWKGGMA